MKLKIGQVLGKVKCMVLWRPIYKYIWFNRGSQEQILEEETFPLVLKDEGKLTKEGREQHFGQSTTFVSWWERVWWKGLKEGQSGRKRENKVGWREMRLEKKRLDHTGPRGHIRGFSLGAMEAFEGVVQGGRQDQISLQISPRLIFLKHRLHGGTFCSKRKWFSLSTEIRSISTRDPTSHHYS